uniref:RNA-directed DNA polymerase n=1 Tax=Caenorhabditis japonica TaxID=281687 RepID=A0A8R1HVU4_CAEJA
MEVMVYIDDVIIFSKTFESHVATLRKVLSRFRAYNLKASPAKCEFVKKSIVFLGHEINETTYSPNKANLNTIKQLPVPTDPKAVLRFLGMAGFFRKFIKKFSTIAEPSTRLNKKDVDFVWTEKQQTAFDTLKRALMTKKHTHDRIARWLVELQQYDIEIHHIDGKRNTVAECIFRAKDEISPLPEEELEDIVEFPKPLDISVEQDKDQDIGIIKQFLSKPTSPIDEISPQWTPFLERISLSNRDNGPVFTAAAFKQFCELLDIGHHRAVPHHSRGNGATERTIRTLYAVIAKHVNNQHSDWDAILQYATFCYNRAVHQTTGETPFFLVFGRDPTLTIDRIIDPAPRSTKTDIPLLEEALITTFEEAWPEAAKNSQRAQEEYQKRANQGAQGSNLRSSFVTTPDYDTDIIFAVVVHHLGASLLVTPVKREYAANDRSDLYHMLINEYSFDNMTGIMVGAPIPIAVTTVPEQGHRLGVVVYGVTKIVRVKPAHLKDQPPGQLLANVFIPGVQPGQLLRNIRAGESRTTVLRLTTPVSCRWKLPPIITSFREGDEKVKRDLKISPMTFSHDVSDLDPAYAQAYSTIFGVYAIALQRKHKDLRSFLATVEKIEPVS